VENYALHYIYYKHILYYLSKMYNYLKTYVSFYYYYYYYYFASELGEYLLNPDFHMKSFSIK
jgi:hypothetical protein